jgi:anthranilate phosphoribosyltransferase
MKTSFPDPNKVLVLQDVEIGECLGLLLDESVGAAEKSAFLDALHRRGETAAELAGFANCLLGKAVRPVISHENSGPLLELCGTGGDRAGYLNISTAAMFVAAGAGACVVKHGNRAFSSKCGSADVLEELGVSLHLDPRRVGGVLREAGCVFLLAGDYHPALAALSRLRRDMAAEGKLTVFNLLGPLLNPAHPEVQLTGIYRPGMLPVYAEAMRLSGRKKAWAVHGEGMGDSGGVDELSILGFSTIHEITPDGESPVFSIQPEDAGLKMADNDSALVGGDARANAARILSILGGHEESSATDMILLNAGAALHLAEMGTSLAESVSLASESLKSGKALRALEALRKASGVAAVTS